MTTTVSPVLTHGWDDQWRQSWSTADPTRWPEVIHHRNSGGGNMDWSEHSVDCGRCGTMFIHSEDCIDEDEYTIIEQTIVAHRLGLCHVVPLVWQARQLIHILNARWESRPDLGADPF